MLALTITLFAVSVLAEAGALFLIFREAQTAKVHLKIWLDAGYDEPMVGSFEQLGLLSPVVAALLGRPRVRFASAGLIAFGLLAGAAGNFLSLAM